MNPIQEYYNTERNAEISWFWDSGFYVWFGDEINGYKSYIRCKTWEEVEEVFRKKIEEEK